MTEGPHSSAPVDVLVIGGGPCGAAAALTLNRHTGHRVALIEGTRYDAPRVGEAASPGLRPLLDYLDAADAIAQGACTMPGYATEAAWGSDDVVARDTLFSGHGSGLLLDRRRFDEALVDLFAARGGCVAQGAWLRRATRAAGGWQVAVDVGGAERTFHARQVIDASGRRSAFSRRAGGSALAVDRLVAVARHVEQADRECMPASTLVEATPEGWWYLSPLPGRRAVVAFMTDADMVASAGLHTAEGFRARLRASTAVRARLGRCTLSTRPQIHPASTRILQEPCGDGWVAAGDAALAVDPLSSIGIGHAIVSGIQAARIAEERLRGQSDLARAYRQERDAHLHAFLRMRQSIYAVERRWTQSRFWQRRHASALPFHGHSRP